jgi:hypothetical protein
MSHQIIKVRRDFDRALIESCKNNIRVKIGSFDCTANCIHNQNTRKEIETEAFDLEFVKCEIAKGSNQLQIEI